MYETVRGLQDGCHFDDELFRNTIDTEFGRVLLDRTRELHQEFVAVYKAFVGKGVLKGNEEAAVSTAHENQSHVA